MMRRLHLSILLICVVFSLFSQGLVEEKQQRLKPEFSIEGGFFEDEVLLEISAPGAVIYYSTDGNKPNKYSERYKRPLKFDETTVLRVIAYKGDEKSKIYTETYFIDEPISNFPIVSVAIPPSILFDPETGLYVKGPNAIDSLWTKDGANFWSKKEVLTNTEIYETDGKCEFNSITGFRLFGGMSRLFPQKSMTVVARDRYGKKRIKHRIFGKEGNKKYKYLVFRNSGSDWGKTHYRDGLMTTLLDDWNIEKQDFRPAHLYLNGRYWGIYNIREKINRYFVADHNDVHEDSLDLIEHRLAIKRGTKQHYLQMLTFLEDYDLSDEKNYAYLKTQMDVDNFMNYQIAQIYFDNQDAGGNIKFWRPQSPTGKWRWILYDTDWGFGLHEAKAYKHNSLEFHTEPDGPAWPNPPWSTFILRKLLENPGFKDQFINRFADHINTTFDRERVLGLIDELETQIEPEISRHLKRWKLSTRKRKSHVEIIRNFGKKRPTYMRKHLREFFDLGEEVPITVESGSGGRVLLNNNIDIRNEIFTGRYFEKLAISIKAIPNYGFRFARWEGIDMDEDVHELVLKVDSRKPLRLKAVFEPYIHPLAGKIILNEVSCNNKLTGDWIEIYNNSEEVINIEGWAFTDSKRDFKFPYFVLQPDSYVIVCEDSTAFRKFFPSNITVVGNFNFGLSKRKERLGIYTNLGASIDSMFYDIEPRDTAFTLALSLPGLDNSDIENWEQVRGFGSPNKPNPYYLESRIREEQELWIRVGVGIGLLLSSIFILKFIRRRKEKDGFFEPQPVNNVTPNPNSSNPNNGEISGENNTPDGQLPTPPL